MGLFLRVFQENIESLFRLKFNIVLQGAQFQYSLEIHVNEGIGILGVRKSFQYSLEIHKDYIKHGQLTVQNAVSIFS